MDAALNMKNINYEKVNIHIKKSGYDVNQPRITMEHFPYMAKKIYYPFPTFQVNYHYKGVLPPYVLLKEKMVSETSVTYQPTYGKSSCVLTYHNLEDLTKQVSLRDNFNIKCDEIYFSYVFLIGQAYQTSMDEKGFRAYMSQLNFAIYCASTSCVIFPEACTR